MIWQSMASICRLGYGGGIGYDRQGSAGWGIVA